MLQQVQLIRTVVFVCWWFHLRWFILVNETFSSQENRIMWISCNFGGCLTVASNSCFLCSCQICCFFLCSSSLFSKIKNTLSYNVSWMECCCTTQFSSLCQVALNVFSSFPCICCTWCIFPCISISLLL